MRLMSTKARQRRSPQSWPPGPKAATFALMLRIFYTAFGSADHLWFWAIWIAAVLSMCIGNLAALTQTNVKRMLAYSSIAHAGYILVAFAASTEIGIAAVLFYLAAYALMKLGAFLVVAHLGGPGEKRLDIKDYAGLGTQQPALAACFALFLLSLLGLPATGGFLGKFYAFQAALDSRVIWLVVIAALNSVVGAYYYLRVIIAMYFWDPQKEFQPIAVTPAIATALALSAAGNNLPGLLPQPRHAFRPAFRPLAALANIRKARVLLRTKASSPLLFSRTYGDFCAQLLRLKKGPEAQAPPGPVSSGGHSELLYLHEDDRKRIERHGLDQHERQNQRKSNQWACAGITGQAFASRGRGYGLGVPPCGRSNGHRKTRGDGDPVYGRSRGLIRGERRRGEQHHGQRGHHKKRECSHLTSPFMN